MCVCVCMFPAACIMFTSDLTCDFAPHYNYYLLKTFSVFHVQIVHTTTKLDYWIS